MRDLLKIFLVISSMICLQIVSISSTEFEKIEPKIVGGHSINIGQAPYQVSVRLTARDRRSYGSGHICGGVVISQRLIATAAHCIYDTNKKAYRKAGEFVLVMGGSFLQNRESTTQQYYVQQVIVHPLYNPSTITNDIALLFINGYIPWRATTVKALPLNSVSVATNTNCVVTGWGVTVNGGSYSSNTLQLATVPIVSYTQCAIGYGILPQSQLCAGYMSGGIDACQGDSGGPLQCNNKLVGIVSYGVDCAKRNYPGVYTNVSSFQSWVVQTNRSLDYTVYKNNNVGLRAFGFTVYAMWLVILAIFMAATKTF